LTPSSEERPVAPEVEPKAETYKPYAWADVRSPARRFSAISFFAGGGGSCCGLQMAGANLRAAVEFSAWAAAVYRRNNPCCRLVRCDIRDITADERASLEFLADARLEPGQLDYFDSSPPVSRIALPDGEWATRAAKLFTPV
jgi:hypothetical protein